MKIGVATEELAINYGNFIDGKASNVQECIAELSTRTKNAYSEMEKVVNQIKSHSL
jgi:hypothetical protein